MKRIETANGSRIMAYEYDDLSQDAKNYVIDEYIDFEIQVMDEDSPYYYLAQEMERMQTPWFLGQEIYHKHKADIEETIRINNYLFDEDGKMFGSFHDKSFLL